ncbi:ATPase [Lysinibacillus sp. PLM2]|nr:ATPase [Lysinibacillus sp. PLM2]
MIIHSLSGPSGTGKSTSALQFAHEYGIRAIIDDGLLIIDGEKRAGTSAKFEKNSLKAIRRAIFEDDIHKEEVIQTLIDYNIDSILIIGTSDKMTKKIANKLNLGDIHYYHYINEVRNKQEIQIAQFVRLTQGMHVMPIPYKQVEQNFFKRFIRKGIEIFSKNKEKIGETTIVQPDFHQQRIDISHKVYIDLIRFILNQYEYVAKVETIHFSMKQYQPIVYIAMSIYVPDRSTVAEKMGRLQELICEQFFQHFEFEPKKVHLYIKGIQQ